MAELTLDQQKALARARARARAGTKIAPAAVEGPQQLPAWTNEDDLIYSSGQGLAEGAIGLPGLPGNVQALTGDILRKMSEWSGVGDPEAAQRWGSQINPVMPWMQLPMQLPTSADIVGGAKKLGLPDYQPQSQTGQYAKSIAAGVPGAALGPGGAIAKTLLAVGPGAATEATRQYTESTPEESWAPPLAGLLTALLIAGRSATTSTRAKLPDPGEMLVKTKAKEDVLWKTLRSQGIKYDANDFANFVNREVKGDLLAEGFDDIAAPSTWQMISRMEKDVGTSPTFDRVDNFRKRFGNIGNGPGADPAASRIVQNKIAKYIPSGPLMTQTGIPSAGIQRLATEAKQTSARRFKGEDAMQRIGAAKRYTSGEQSGLVNQFASLGRRIETKKTRSRYTPAEKAAVEKVIGGSTGRKITYSAGETGANIIKGAGRANINPMLAGGAASYLGGQMFGPIGGLLGAGVQQGLGILSKKGALGATRRDAEAAARLMMRDPRAMPAQANIDEFAKVIRALLAQQQTSPNRE